MRASYLIVPLVTVCVLANCTQTCAETFVDNTAGYSLRVPQSWQRIPSEEMRARFSAVYKPGSTAPNYVAGFESAQHVSHFTYPYVLVQLHSYGGGLSLASISREETEQMVSQLTGVRPKELTGNMREEAAKLLVQATFESPTVLSDPPGFVMDTTLNVGGVGNVRCRSRCIFGRTSAVFLHFYAREQEWEKYSHMFATFVDGFDRTRGEKISFAERTVTTSGKELDSGGGLNWQRIGLKAIGGAVVGAIVAVIGWARGRKSNPAPANKSA